MFQDACNPLRLVTDIGDPLPGGAQEAATYLWSYVHSDGSEHPEKESPWTFLSISGKAKYAEGVTTQQQ